MASGAHTELVLAGLLFAVAVLVTAARVLDVPYPIFLVIGGLGFGLLPGHPDDRARAGPRPADLPAAAAVRGVVLHRPAGAAPEHPPDQPARDRARARDRAGAVALVAHAVIDGMSWPAAFVLGAIVSPTDPVAATAIAGRLGVPRRVVTIVEGEALINDATALVAYKVAVAAVLTGTFSALEAGAQFVYSGIGGAALGLAIGWVIAQVRERLDDPPVEITIALVRGYAAYLPAEELGLSGVTAAVAIGLYMGSQTSRLTNSTVRMQGDAVWQILVVPAQLVPVRPHRAAAADDPRRPARRRPRHATDLILYGGVVTATVIVIRLVWTFVFAYLPHWLFRGLRERDRSPKLRNVAIVAWMGMRGAVSLAAALALPVATIDSGARFDRAPADPVLVFCVILGTLVLQGLTLPVADPAARRRARRQRRHRAGGARPPARRRGGTRADRRPRARGLDARATPSTACAGSTATGRKRFAARFDDDVDDGAIEDRSTAWGRMMFGSSTRSARRSTSLRRAGEITDEVKRTVERDLDLEERRLDEVRR